MNSNFERKKRIKELIDQALDLDPTARAAFLNAACAGDVELCAEVESLLSHEQSVAVFLAQPAWRHVVQDITKVRQESLAERQLGRYQIHERLGHGGMGEVWRATDEQLKREVAIKILPSEFSRDGERVRRFQQEAYAVSALKHANIITIHEIGESGDLHFIVTELVEGKTLRDLLTGEPMGWRRAVRIVSQIAAGLSVAHTAGIIHRDIKPENVIVQSNDHVKVLDFGIAKWVKSPTESAVHDSTSGIETRIGATPGTLKYMSPEQARAEILDPRTDVFSLGLVLYEMIVGRHPYSETSEEKVGAALKSSEEIAPLNTSDSRIPAALDRILTRALRKNRDERYDSASDMLPDLDELKSLIEVSRQERGQKLFRAQNANQLLTQFAVLYDADRRPRLSLGALWTIWRFADLKRGKLEQDTIRKSLRSSLARLALLVLTVAVATMIAAALLSMSEVWEEQVLRDGHTAAVRRAVFSPDGRLLVSVGEDKQVIVWDFARRERLATFTDHTDWVAALAFSPDGEWFATGGYDRTVIVWDALKLQKATVLRGHQRPVTALAFSPDGQVLVSANDWVEGDKWATFLWRVGSWERFAKIQLWAFDIQSMIFTAGNRMIYHTDVSPNTWDVSTGQPVDDQFDPAWSSGNAVLSPDGTLLAGVNGDGEVIFVDFKRRRMLSRIRAHQDNGRAVAFSPDGRLLATGAENIILWDALTHRKITTIDFPSIVWTALFSPDGRWLVTTHGDGAIRVWDVFERQRAVGFNQHDGAVRTVSWAPDGKRFASAGEDRVVMVWNTDTGRREMVLAGHPTRVMGLAFGPAGKTLASVDFEGTIIIWDLDQQREQLRFGYPGGATTAYCLALSPDGRMVATSHGVYEAASGRQINLDRFHASAIYGVAFSADGTRLAVAHAEGRQFLFDTATWRVIGQTNFSARQFISVSFAPDAEQVVTGEDGGTVQLWDTQPLHPSTVIGHHTARIKSVAFSPDGKQVVSAGDDNVIALWDVSSQKLITRIGLHIAPVYAVAFAPEGGRLVAGGHDHSVRLYTRHRSLWGFRLD